MLNLTRLKELALFDFYHSLASLKSLAYIIPYFFFWFIIFHYFSQNAADWLQSPEGIFTASYLLEDQELVTQMFINRSATLSLYLLISASITPLFILLAANNQYSSDASIGAFRFILTRATRTELYLSRFLSVTLLVFICTFITSLWASTLALLNNEDDISNIINYGFQTLFLLSCYNLPFIAFMSTVSTLTRSAFGCLFFGMMMYILLVTLIFICKDDVSYIIYLIPSVIKPLLTNVNIDNIINSLAALTCYTLVYFSIGWFIFKRRDM